MRPRRRTPDFGLRMAPRSLQRGPAAPHAPGHPGVITSAPRRTANSTAWQTLISTAKSKPILQNRIRPPARVPKSKYFHGRRRAGNSVVEVVVNAGHMHASHAEQSGIQGSSADRRLRRDQDERLLELLHKGLRDIGTVDDPPLPSLRDSESGTGSDENREEKDSPPGQTTQDYGSVDDLSPLNLVDSGE